MSKWQHRQLQRRSWRWWLGMGMGSVDGGSNLRSGLPVPAASCELLKWIL